MEENKTPKVIIDGTEYELNSLSDNTKSMINMLRMADREIKQLEFQLTLARIARQTIANNLKSDLAKAPEAE